MNRAQWAVLIKILGILACTYLFILGIQGLGTSFKLMGEDFAMKILQATSSPFIGLMIGILATALVQSSSTTTSVIVGMVAAGAISIEGAIPMVMGANIGTTVTNLLVSIGHITRKEEFKRAFAAAVVHDFFNLIAVAIMLPLEIATGFLAKTCSALGSVFQNVGGMKLGSPLKLATQPVLDWVVKVLQGKTEDPAITAIPILVISVFLMFGMLYSLVKILRSLVVRKSESFFDEHLFKSPLRAGAFGFVVTVAVQSSSITTSLVIPLAGAGILKLAQIFPYTLGANVGTTITAIFAAMATGEVASISVAFAHTLFNLLGILIIWPHKRIRQIPVILAEKMAELTLKNRAIPIIFILGIFFVIPIILILTFN